MPRKLSIDLAETLINAVKKREVLYNLRHAGYKNRNQTELAWKEVSDEVGRNVLFCRTTWAQLRSTFNKILAQTKNQLNGSAASKEPKWYLYQQMLFMKEYVAHGCMTENLSSVELEETVSVKTEMPSPTNSEVSLQTSTSTQASWDTNLELVLGEQEMGSVAETSGDATAGAGVRGEIRDVTPGPPKKKRKSEGDPVQKAFLELLDAKAKDSQQEPPPPPIPQEDPDLQIFKGLLPFYKQLTDRNKRVFVAKTTTLCMELLDNQENV